MVASINELNQKNMNLLYINNRMEIQNLQAQINPHFIYNTLDNIRYLIAQDARKADELLGRFTHILRYSINNTKQRSFLQDDMEYIEDYLVIQKTRFGKRFQYEVDVAPECNQVMIPKLLLQPLIENSLKYGFRRKADIKVAIHGWIDGEYLMLQVQDDGPGQPAATLASLRCSLETEEILTEHIGLRNINRRIILEYGRESGMQLDSMEGEGFSVTLKLWIGVN
jgi:sensor histidine kinase YesM